MAVLGCSAKKTASPGKDLETFKETGKTHSTGTTTEYSTGSAPALLTVATRSYSRIGNSGQLNSITSLSRHQQAVKSNGNDSSSTERQIAVAQPKRKVLSLSGEEDVRRESRYSREKTGGLQLFPLSGKKLLGSTHYKE